MTDTDKRDHHYYGGTYVNLLVDSERAALLKQVSTDLSSITLDDRQLCDFELLTTGGLFPTGRFHEPQQLRIRSGSDETTGRDAVAGSYLPGRL